MSRSLRELSLRASRVTMEYQQKEGRSPTLQELAEILKVEPEQAAEALEAGQIPLSLTPEDGEKENQLPIAVEAQEEKITEKLSLHQAVLELPERDQKILSWRYLKSATQSETARQLGMTQVQVSRREKVILRVLREKIG